MNQSMNPYLLKCWHVMRLDCKRPPFSLVSPHISVCLENECCLSAWTSEKSSKETHQYYSKCGTAVNKEEALIRYYFQRAFDYSVILLVLEKYHATACLGVLCTLGFANTRIRKRNTNTNDGDIYQAIQQELDGPGCMRSYRAMWHTLRLD